MILTVRERTYSSNGQWCREDLAIPLTTAIAASGRHQSCSASSSSQCQEEDCRGGCRQVPSRSVSRDVPVVRVLGRSPHPPTSDLRPPTSAPKLLPPTRCNRAGMYSAFGPSVPHSWYTYVCQALCVIDLVDALQQCCSSTP